MKRISLLLLTIPFLIIVLLSFDDNEILNYSNLSIDSKTIDANTIRTWFRSNGSFNRNPTTGSAGFEWPKNQFKFARYVSGLWIGAKVGNDTNVTVCNYEYEYLPGYTDNSGVPQGLDSSNYRIYKLTRGVNDEDRLQWPNSALGNSNQGAPVYYDSLSGVVKARDMGDQTLFYLYTDSYTSAHNAQGGSTSPLKADIKQLNFASHFTSGGGLESSVISQFIIINRSTNTWSNAFFSFWTDDDLGDGTDDVKGCDSALQLGYTYNFTNNDPIYGANPPCVGTIFLKGALQFTGNSGDVASYCVNETRITKTGYKNTGLYSFASNGTPANYVSSYRLMNGLSGGGGLIINPVSGFTTKLFYSGNPVAGTGWNQPTPGDQRFMMSTGPANVAPGDTQVIVIAQLIGRGSSNLNSITVLKQYATELKEYYRDCYDFSPLQINNQSTEVSGYSLKQNYPNPFNPTTKINYELRVTNYVSLKVFDVLGKEVADLVNEKKNAGSYVVDFDGSNFPSGVYFYRLEVGGNLIDTKRMILLK